jgi:hypothetical protein
LTGKGCILDQGGHGVLLPLVESADQRRQEHSKRPPVRHGGRVYITNQVSGLEDLRPSNETLRVHDDDRPPEGEEREFGD